MAFSFSNGLQSCSTSSFHVFKLAEIFWSVLLRAVAHTLLFGGLFFLGTGTSHKPPVLSSSLSVQCKKLHYQGASVSPLFSFSSSLTLVCVALHCPVHQREHGENQKWYFDWRILAPLLAAESLLNVSIFKRKRRVPPLDTDTNDEGKNIPVELELWAFEPIGRLVQLH